MIREHLRIAEILKGRLYELLQQKFSDLVKEEPGDDALYLTFNIPGLHGSSHHFEYPIKGYLTNESANKIVNEIRKIDPNLADCISFTYLSKIKIEEI